MVRRLLYAVGAALTAFHVWLFAGQVWSGALTDPSLAFRWVLAIGLVAGLLLIRRQGASLVWGRKAIAMWVLAALLHGPALASRAGEAGPTPVPEVVVSLTQALVGLVGLVGLVLLGAWRRVRPATATRVSSPLVPAFTPALTTSAGPCLAPRPPPL